MKMPVDCLHVLINSGLQMMVLSGVGGSTGGFRAKREGKRAHEVWDGFGNHLGGSSMLNCVPKKVS